MSHGISIRNAAGVEVFNSQRRGSLFVECVTVPNNTAVSKSYPSLAGRTVWVVGEHFQGVDGAYSQPYTLTYPSGVPTIEFASVPYGGTWWVFVL